MTSSDRRDGDRLPVWRQCPGCEYDIVTGEGERGCNWYDCPYLPEDLKVFCPHCNFNFATEEGSPRCGYPPSCKWAEPGYSHAVKAKEVRQQAVGLERRKSKDPSEHVRQQ